jgi:hypothetical protein
LIHLDTAAGAYQQLLARTPLFVTSFFLPAAAAAVRGHQLLSAHLHPTVTPPNPFSRVHMCGEKERYLNIKAQQMTAQYCN